MVYEFMMYIIIDICMGFKDQLTRPSSKLAYIFFLLILIHIIIHIKYAYIMIYLVKKNTEFT